MSFAQFEREVIGGALGTRWRLQARGMCTGGKVPLGRRGELKLVVTRPKRAGAGGFEAFAETG